MGCLYESTAENSGDDMFKGCGETVVTARAEEPKDGLSDWCFNKGFPKEDSIIKRCVLEVERGMRSTV